MIFSYRDSFCIARHVTGKDGSAGVLINNDNYSNTTARQISGVRQAVNHIKAQWDVDDPTAELPKQLEHWQRRIKYASEQVIAPKIRKATQAKRYDELQTLVKDANSFCTFFGVKPRFSVPEFGLLKATLEAERVKAEAKAKRDGARKQKELLADLAKRRLEAQEILKAWQAGETLDWSDKNKLRYLPEAYLRIACADGEETRQETEVETSLGARVPIAHAIRAMRLIQRLVANVGLGQTSDGPLILYKRNGHSIHLGHYTLDSVIVNEITWTESVPRVEFEIKAGCHTITRAEFERFALVLDEWQASHHVRIETEVNETQTTA